MSTYYCFTCEKCKLKGGFFSRQAWGSGNADIIDSFRFIMRHSMCCGVGFIGVDSEHGGNYEYFEEDNSEDLLGYFPCSSDWKDVEEGKYDTKDDKESAIQTEKPINKNIIERIDDLYKKHEFIPSSLLRKELIGLMAYYGEECKAECLEMIERNVHFKMEDLKEKNKRYKKEILDYKSKKYNIKKHRIDAKILDRIMKLLDKRIDI